MKRNDYRNTLKAMTPEQLERWIDRKSDLLLSLIMLGANDGASTPLHTKISYAKNLLEKATP